MKYIKTYETEFIAPWDYPNVEKIKKLINPLTKLCNSFGYNERNYILGGDYETEFISNDDDYMFYMKISIRWATIKFTYASKNKNKTVKNILNELKNIKGLVVQRGTDYSEDTITFNVGDDVDNIIEQIEIKTTANKYNL